MGIDVRRGFARSSVFAAGLLLSFFAAAPVSAAGWAEINVPTTDKFFGIDFEGQYGIAVGFAVDTSYSLWSDDYGKNWSKVPTGAGQTLWDVSMAPGSRTAIAVGNSGKAVKTTNGGMSWTLLSTGTTKDLMDVVMTSPTVGWLVGKAGLVMKTTNGGTGWSPQTPPVSSDLKGVDFLSDQQMGIAVGNSGKIIMTQNGGTTWTAVDSGTVETLYATDYVSASVAYAVGTNGTVRKTQNGGSTWKSVVIGGVPAGTTFYDVAFMTTSVGTIVGSSGQIYVTSDGGVTWTKESSGTTYPLDAVTYDTVSHRWAGGANGTMLLWDATPPTKPNIVSPLNGAFMTAFRPTVTWIASTDGESSLTGYEMMYQSIVSEVAGGAGATSYAFVSDLAEGSHSFYLRSVDAAGNRSDWSTVGFSLDRTAPTVGPLSPSFASTGVTTKFSASASDNLQIDSCHLKINSADTGAMTYNAATNKYEKSTMFLGAGTYPTQVTCTDKAGNSASDSVIAVVVTGAALNDVTAPTVGAVNPISATVDVPVVLHFTATDDVAVTSCRVSVNGADQGAATYSAANGRWEKTTTFGDVSNPSVKATCSDAAGNSASGPEIGIAVGASAQADVTAPTVGAVTPLSATVGVPIALSATYSDNVGAVSCELGVEDVNQGVMTLSGGVASRSHTFASVGSHSVQASCEDAAGNVGAGPIATVVVSAAGSGATAPSASRSSIAATPASVQADGSASATVTVTVRDSSGVALAGKTVALTSSRGGADSVTTIAGVTNDLGQALFSVRSTSAGATALSAVADGTLLGSVSVTFVASGTTPSGTPGAGSLVKLACPADAPPSHRCKAVYYIGADGRRHAFPHSNVFFTWYGDFGNVVTVSDAFMAALPIGKNITHRPGVKLVKFMSLNTIYVVSLRGTLRPIASEAVVKQLYGDAWGSRLQDIDDSVYMDYVFGTPVNGSGEYDPAAETAAASSIAVEL